MQTVVKEGLGAPSKYLTPSDIATYENGTQSLVPFAVWFDYAPQLLFKQTTGKWRATLLPAWKDGGARSGIMGGSSFVIPAKAKNPELAWLAFEYLVFKPAGYQAVYGPNSVYPNGLNTSLPSYKPALNPDQPLFKPVAALGNQDIWSIFTKAADTVPGGYSIPSWFNRAVPYLGNNLQKLLGGSMSVDDVLSNSTQQIQKNLITR
jgi:lactose/L-arabinose transport system substrate-binding protein